MRHLFAPAIWRQIPWRSPVIWIGSSLGLSAVCVLHQITLLTPLTPAVQAGLLFAATIGLLWGCCRRETALVAERRWLPLYLLGLIAIWPEWLSFAKGVLLLADAWWSVQAGLSDMVVIAMALAGLVVPTALGVSWLRASLLSATPSQTVVRLGQILLVAALVAWLEVGSLVSIFGLTVPTLVLLGATFVVCWTDRSTSPSSTKAHKSSSLDCIDRMTVSAILAAASVGTLWASVAYLLGNLLLWTTAIWITAFACAASGLAVGLCAGRWASHRAVVVIGLIWSGGILCGHPWALEQTLWQNSQLTNSTSLWLMRSLLIAAAVAPGGLVMGLVLSRHREFRLTWNLAAVTVIAGLCTTQFLISRGGASIALLCVASAFGVFASGLLVELPLHQRRGFQRLAISTGLLMVVVASACLTPAWNANRASRLLFSTMAFLAARGGWDTEQLPHLDDLRPLTSESPRNGWTLWQSRGGQLQVRQFGLPRGVASTQSAWHPESAPEVAHAAWPLVLVDQPARVLLAGLTSGTTLRSCLAFPVRSVTCCEEDAGLVRMIRGSMTHHGLPDPLSDDRVTHHYGPATWLPTGNNERFDVILSAPPQAALAIAATWHQVEHYRRAAALLEPQGIFCQRFLSVDFGPKPLLSAAMTMRQAFAQVACLEVGPGDYLLLGAHQSSSLIRPDLPSRLQTPHVTRVFAKCGWDWTYILNLPAYDGAALQELCEDHQIRPNGSHEAPLTFLAAREVMRWGPKLQETARAFSAKRRSMPDFPPSDLQGPPRSLVEVRSRRGRLVEWLGTAGEEPALLRRLTETVTQQQLVQDYPDVYWWEYRKPLREQLQNHPRSAIQPVSHASGGTWHAEDRHRKDYFTALGAMTTAEKPSRPQLQAMEALLEPYDPLLTLFAHQELADLYDRADLDPDRELDHRLHVIYFAPHQDASVRNVVAAIDLLSRSRELSLSSTERFDRLNGLLQMLRGRWEVRNTRPSKSARVTLQEVDRSLVSVERALDVMDTLAAESGVSSDDWRMRRTVIERLLVRPFRTYREELVRHTQTSRLKTQQILHEATKPGT